MKPGEVKTNEMEKLYIAATPRLQGAQPDIR